MKSAADCLRAIREYSGPPLRFMEVCGTHTDSIFRSGLRDVLPETIRLISGPGCPVCVTPGGYIGAACRLSREDNNVLCTFGDMMRVPGTAGSLAEARAQGGRVRIVYSPMEVLDLAEKAPDLTFYMTAVGFETTLPIYALMLEEMCRRNIKNVRFLTAVKAILPALRWICAGGHAIDGFIGPGHVSAIIGADAYREISGDFGVPVAVAGFEYEHLAAALWDLVNQCRAGSAAVHNLYPNVVTPSGNTAALTLIDKYFVKADTAWRGLGVIEGSGYVLRPAFAEYSAGDWDADSDISEPPGCLCGSVIIGASAPTDCPFFGTRCTPLDPVGPCMVSAEGACGIYYRNRERL
ncbi:hydrogenase expression/formation protein HypD [Sporobacter termitidis DSM 10068]|uniref:Hydrogenase expression/formation protein HypD n=1 Tax=Sporobacter termitidis DSM 10068 TaxID=1123282 RepID=A0A1M5Z0C3_9FIRM|nr:hydrogenase formation protein HypD [Sporobacter termitidis]SHI17717.1 hydrogenase expression/formation protein HypD [Sporobacter termitidis DSM 10068]